MQYACSSHAFYARVHYTGRHRIVFLTECQTPTTGCGGCHCVCVFERSSRRAPVPELPPGYSVYRRPRMAEEGVPANAELV